MIWQPTRLSPAPRRTTSRILATLVAPLAIGACASDSDSDSAAIPSGGVPVVAATTSIWGDITTNIACGGADVATIVPVGGDPHSFEPSLRDREVLGNAALVIANGLGLEEALDDALDAVAREGVGVFRVTEHAELLGDDPHIWADPTLIAAAVPDIAAAMTEAGLDIDPSCAEDYTAELLRIDAEMEKILSAVPAERRHLVTSHDSLAYFAARHSFDVIGVVIPGGSTLGEANPADLADLAAAISEAGVPAVFGEEQHSTADVEALANEVGDVEVVTLHTDALGPPESGADSYTGLLLTNARLIAAALG